MILSIIIIYIPSSLSLIDFHERIIYPSHSLSFEYPSASYLRIFICNSHSILITVKSTQLFIPENDYSKLLFAPLRDCLSGRTLACVFLLIWCADGENALCRVRW